MHIHLYSVLHTHINICVHVCAAYGFVLLKLTFPLDSFMSCLHYLQGYSTGEFQALQLIVLAVFGAVD